MKKILRLLAALLMGMLLLRPVSTLARSDDLPPVTSYINDYAGIIDDADRQEMEDMGRQLAADTGSQVIVVTMDDLDGRDAAMMATEIGNEAQAGSDKLDNGVVILVSIDDKQRFMAIGSGLEGVITDIDAEHLQQDYLVPQFREGNYSQGLKDLYGATVRSIEAGTAAGEIGADPDYGQYEEEELTPVDFVLMFLMPLVLMMLVLVIIVSRRKESSTILLSVGERYQIRLREVDFHKDPVIVSSSDPAVATVTPDGIITARHTGICQIKVDKSPDASYEFRVEVARKGRSSRRNDDMLDALFWSSVYNNRHHHHHYHDDHWSGGGFGGGGFSSGGGFSGGGGGFSGGGSGGSW